MKRKTTVIIILAAAFLAAAVSAGCDKAAEQPDLFDYSKPADLTPVMQAYEWHLQHADEESALTAMLMPDLPGFDFVLFCDTSFVLRLPEYAGSQQPFLVCAEDFYNSCMLSWNIYSNSEVHLRSQMGCGLSCEKEVLRCTQGISTEVINDDTLRHEAEAFKDSMLALVSHCQDGDTDDGVSDAITHVIAFNEAIERKSYRFYDDEDTFLKALSNMNDIVNGLSEERFGHYLDAGEDRQLRTILDELAACGSFDEQCSLWRKWANCGKSEAEDEWIVAVATLLMKSGHYSPILNEVWIIWRALCQSLYFGASRDSCIPNDYYNSYRRLCYLACLPRVESHPDDVFAMNCAASIGGRTNMNRFGQNYFGNEAMIESLMMLPNRFYLDGNEDEEDDEE